MNKLSKSDIEAMTYTQCVNEITNASKYINELIDALPSKIKDFVFEENWEEVKGVPKERKPIQFRNTDGDWLEGIYIEAEKMFFLGFEESGEFLFHCDVTDWQYIPDRNMSQEGKQYSEKVSYNHFK